MLPVFKDEASEPTPATGCRRDRNQWLSAPVFGGQTRNHLL